MASAVMHCPCLVWLRQRTIFVKKGIPQSFFLFIAVSFFRYSHTLYYLLAERKIVKSTLKSSIVAIFRKGDYW